MLDEFVKIGLNSYIRREDIVLITSYEMKSIKHIVKNAKEDSKVIDLTSGKKILGVIIMKNGTIFLVNTLPDTIRNRIEGPEDKSSKDKKGR